MGTTVPIISINLELIRAGMEVIYLGYHRSACAIARAAVQEDVAAIAISSYNGGHLEFFRQIAEHLRLYGADDIRIFAGGGGTITPADAKAMSCEGVDRVFFAGTPLTEIARHVVEDCGKPRHGQIGVADVGDQTTDRRLGRQLTSAIDARTPIDAASKVSAKHPITIGFTGPGGVGKTTVIDELTLRVLKRFPEARVGILTHDPTLPDKGALLGDRAAMVYANDPHVFVRSVANDAHSDALSAQTGACVALLRQLAFDFLFIETVGIGQQAAPFPPDLMDKTVMVMGPDYGSQLQLHKIAMLDLADIVVVNKSDRPGSETAKTEISNRLSSNAHHQQLVASVAKRHRDPGVDSLFRAILA